MNIGLIKGTPGKVESTRSEEEPHRVFHEVYRPVIQELREVIQPYRRYVQEIQPVIEEIQQIVSSAQRSRQPSTGGGVGVSDMSVARPTGGIPSKLLSQQFVSPVMSPPMSYSPSKNIPTTGSTGITNELSKRVAAARPLHQQELMPLGQMPAPLSKALPVAPTNIKLTGTLIQQHPSAERSSQKTQMSSSGKPVQYDTYFLMGGALDGIALDKRVGLLRPNTQTTSNSKQQMDAQYFLDYSVPIGFDLSKNQEFKSKLFDNFKDNYKTVEIDLTKN